MKKVINALIGILLILNIFLYRNIYDYKKTPSNLVIYVLDVGQAEAIVIKTPNNEYGLIDTGKGSNILYELPEIMPFLKRDFEFVIITHSDSDHMEALTEIIQRYEIQNLFINKSPQTDPLYQEVISLIQKHNIDTFSLNNSNDFVLDDISFNVIWPNEDLFNGITDTNANSIGLEISYKNFTLFTAGDLPTNYELESIRNLTNHKVDILKVGHHGSETSTSSAFIDEINPLVSLISVGTINSYGHPHESVLNTLRENNVEIYRTDIEGRIKLETNGIKFCIETKIKANCYQS
jgi:competence protein ComEC